MVAITAMCVAVVLVAFAEMLHARKVRRVAALAFGPQEEPAVWARGAGWIRIVACGALAWGLTTLFLLEPKTHRGSDEIPDRERKHLILVLDVSPSMRLVDAGPEGIQSRMSRGRDVLDSFFGRVGIRQYFVSVIATYNGAIPVVERSRDPETVRNILNDLPMHYAFKRGDTDLFAGLERAVEVAKPLPPRSTTLILLTDGDTIPATGMPKMPVSVANKLVIGVGDSREGSFIDGKNSRQESSILRQLAIRMGGTYHDANEKQVSSELIRTFAQSGDTSDVERLSLREYALIVTALAALALALLPLLLQKFGTHWRPGVRGKPAERKTMSEASAIRSKVAE